MNIEDFKKDVLQHTVKPGIIIFENSDNSFVANQYIEEIAKQRHMSIEQVDDISEISGRSNDIFGMTSLDSVLHICRVKEFDAFAYDISLIDRDDIVIVCDKALGAPRWDDKIVKIPRLEQWQIKDYLYSKVEGVDRKQLDWLQELCGNDIYRINEEIDKIVLFDKKEQNKMFSKFIDDNVFSDLSTYNIFNMSNAILSKDLITLQKIWSEIDRIDVSALGLVKILQNSFRLILIVKGSSNCPDNISPKQFWILRKQSQMYTNKQLLSGLELLTSIDLRLKTGLIEASIILDFVILHILSL